MCQLLKSTNCVRAMLGLVSRIKFIRKHVIRHVAFHQILPCLHSTVTSEDTRFAIEEFESRLQLPVRSCFIGNYRVGYGNLQDYLARDPELTERAYREELRASSIADLPAWEIPRLEHDETEGIHQPPPGWRVQLEGTRSPAASSYSRRRNENSASRRDHSVVVAAARDYTTTYAVEDTRILTDPPSFEDLSSSEQIEDVECAEGRTSVTYYRSHIVVRD